ncbi:MAG: fluoride efflux transporter CrcB [Planctomycetia bacterium]|nr:fluoride efflux transporter CrcB [Planctomycetia bacterium]
MKKAVLIWLSIGVFGFFGAMARYGIARLLGRFSALFPFGTFFINISGCFFLGWFLTWAQPRLNIPDSIRLGIAVGFVGAYTTFSTYMFESDRMLSEGQVMRGMLYILGSVMIGIIAVRLGVVLGQRMS